VYTDARFGMNNIEGLCWWFSAAADGTNSSIAYKALVTAFYLKGLDLNETTMD